MKKLIFILLFIPLMGFGQKNMKTVTVRKGKHYPTKLYFNIDRAMKAEADFVFDSNCYYYRNEYNGLNKLFGIHPLFGGVHRNSARFVWMPSIYQDSIDLYYYIYLNKVSPQENKKQKEYIYRVAVNDLHNYKVLDYLDKYEFYIDGVLLKEFITPKRNHYFLGLSFMPFVYVGGTFTLPFDISLRYQIIY